MAKAASAMCVVALAALLGPSGVGCGRKSEPTAPPDAVVARVGERAITVQDLLAEKALREAEGRPVETAESLVEAMVMRLALLERAHRSGLADDPLARRRLESLLIGLVKERELEPRMAAIEISDAEIEAAYERRKAREYTRPAQVRLAGLRLDVARNASDAKRAETRARLGEARERLLADPPRGGRGPAAGGFGALAMAYTDDQVSRYRGGDLGWLEDGATLTGWPAPVLQAGRALPKGRVSEVLEADGGLYLVMKTDERPARVTPFSAVQPALRQSLLVRRREACRDTFAAETLRLAEVSVFSNRLDTLRAALPAAVAPAPGAPQPFFHL